MGDRYPLGVALGLVITATVNAQSHASIDDS
jgi:hypothetical protein